MYYKGKNTTVDKKNLLNENYPHEAGSDNDNRVQSCHQGTRWLFCLAHMSICLI